MRRGIVSARIFSNVVHKSISPDPSMLSSSSALMRSFSSTTDDGFRRRPMRDSEPMNRSAASGRFPGRNPQGRGGFRDDDGDNFHPRDDGRKSRYGFSDKPSNPNRSRPSKGDNRMFDQPSGSFSQRKSNLRDEDDDPFRGNQGRPRPSRSFENIEKEAAEDNLFGESRIELNSSTREEVESQASDDNFLEKFKLGVQKKEKPLQFAQEDLKTKQDGSTEMLEPEPEPQQPQDADEIFRKMKETGLIPNAVAMLDGLCKDGLVREAMKLFGLMREKGTFPEVVIYTAVVDGFCKAQKFDDAKRIFRKMQDNGITPNAFSYTTLVKGLYKGKRLEDAVEFCVEMLEAGHSPNVATFVGLVNLFCREKGVEEARSIIATLRQKGYSVDEKAVRDHLNKKGPSLPLIREAIFGKVEA